MPLNTVVYFKTTYVLMKILLKNRLVYSSIFLILKITELSVL